MEHPPPLIESRELSSKSQIQHSCLEKLSIKSFQLVKPNKLAPSHQWPLLCCIISQPCNNIKSGEWYPVQSCNLAIEICSTKTRTLQECFTKKGMLFRNLAASTRSAVAALAKHIAPSRRRHSGAVRMAMVV